MKAVAVVLASGSGQRFEAGISPKHLTPILGTPTLVWALDTIIVSGLFSSVVVVVREKDLLITENVVKDFLPDESSSIFFTVGADDRTQSFISGFKFLKNASLVDSESIVALFDANRPLTPKEQLESLFDVVLRFGCACPARPIINGVARIESDKIQEVPEKSSFVEFVTPEFLNLGFFAEIEADFMDGHKCFVEFSLEMGCKPSTVQASSLNTKLTYPEDKTYLEGLAIDNSIVNPRK